MDWSRGAGGIAEASYDRVLIDAPCSGMGTLRRRPELALRRSTGDVADLAALQRSILARAATLVRPGGRVIYAVCSVLREEAEDVMAHAIENAKGALEPAPFDSPEALALVADQATTTLRLLPRAHGTDGYFIASLLRVE